MEHEFPNTAEKVIIDAGGKIDNGFIAYKGDISPEVQKAIRYLIMEWDYDLIENKKIMLKAEDLKKYGKVVKCEEINGAFEVKITDGFDGNATKTFELIYKIDKAVGHIYSVIKKCVTDKNLFDYRLAKPEK